MNAIQTNQSFLDSSPATSVGEEEFFVEQIGKTVARSLDKELAYISPKVLQKLEASRELALSKQKKGTSDKSASSMKGFFSRFGLLSPVLVVMVLVVSIAQWQKNARINDLADVDSALLSDTVPPDAYIDDGFKLFMKKMVSENKVIETNPEQSVDSTVNEKTMESVPADGSLSDPSNNQ